MDVNFPPNSKNPQPASERKIEKVTVTEAVARPRSLGKRFKDLFIGGDSRNVLHYVVMDVLVPQAKDMLSEAVSQGFERLIYGENRPRRHNTRSVGSPGPINYTRYAARGNNPIGRTIREEERSPTAKVRGHGIDDILLATRPEAETVLTRMYDILREYETVSVADLYSLVGWSASYVDQKWGWTDLHGSAVTRVHGGYILTLPTTVALD